MVNAQRFLRNNQEPMDNDGQNPLTIHVPASSNDQAQTPRSYEDNRDQVQNASPMMANNQPPESASQRGPPQSDNHLNAEPAYYNQPHQEEQTP